jgi:ppGpp synthetase/RelA/SpoT-type nucleotidyltranferase
MLSKTRIDKLGESLRDGKVDVACIRVLEEFRSLHAQSYRFVEDTLTNKMGLRVTGRPSKSTIAIIDKLKRETVRLSQMQDIAGCRVLVDGGLSEQDVIIDNMQILLGNCIIDDKRNSPTNGYRAVHVISLSAGRPVEIQVRTKPQHLWADLSEKIADRFGHEIKYGKGNPDAISFLKNLSSVIHRSELLEEKRMALSVRKMHQGKSKGLIREIKRLNDERRLLQREWSAIFSGKKR